MLQEILLVALLAGFSTFTPENFFKCSECSHGVQYDWQVRVNQVQQPKMKELIMVNS